MDINNQIRHNLEIAGHIISNTSYYYYNLNYLIIETNAEEKIVFDSYPVLKKLRIAIWSLIVLDLHKLISYSSNDKLSIQNQLEIIRKNHKLITWEHKLEEQDLEIICSELAGFQSKIKKIKDIRDKQIAHLDDIKLDFKLELVELWELIYLCQITYNKISFALNNSTTIWAFSELEMFNPLVKNINKYAKFRELYYRNSAAMIEKIEISELAKIIRQ